MTSRRAFVSAAGGTAFSLARGAQKREFDVHDYGAVGDGARLDTVALQKAVAGSSASGIRPARS